MKQIPTPIHTLRARFIQIRTTAPASLPEFKAYLALEAALERPATEVEEIVAMIQDAAVEPERGPIYVKF